MEQIDENQKKQSCPLSKIIPKNYPNNNQLKKEYFEPRGNPQTVMVWLTADSKVKRILPEGLANEVTQLFAIGAEKVILRGDVYTRVEDSARIRESKFTGRGGEVSRYFEYHRQKTDERDLSEIIQTK